MLATRTIDRAVTRRADAFAALTDRLVAEVIPPVEMAGCTARLLDSVESALGPAPARP